MVIRDAWRALRSGAGATTFSLLILSSAIAAATVTFSVVDAVVLRSLPFEDSDRLVVVGPHQPRIAVHSYPEFTAWRDSAEAFIAIAATRVGPVAQVTTGSGVLTGRAWRTTASLFDVFRVRPLVGRLFTEDNERAGQNGVAVIGYDFWQSAFGGDVNVIGRSIRFGGANSSGAARPESVEILGVVPDGFAYPFDIEPKLWIPLEPGSLANRPDSDTLQVIGRLQDHVTIEQAQAQVEGLSAAAAVAAGLTRRHYEPPVLVSFYDTLVDDVKGWMLLVLSAAGLILLIACVNVANLTLARSVDRAGELALRSSLGASRSRLVFGLIAEGLMLSLVAGGIGVLMAYWGLGLVTAALPCCIPRAGDIAVDLRVLAVALSAAVSAGVGFAVVPAWLAARASPAVLLSHRTATATPGHRRWRSAFITAEVSLVAALLVVSTLFVTSFVRVVQADLGFDRSDLVAFELTDYEGNRAPLLEALRATPGVASAVAYSGPLLLVTEAFGGSQSALTLRVADDPDSTVATQATQYRVPPEYFTTAGIAIVSGRGFSAADASRSVAIVDELLVRALFADGRDPIGARLSRGESAPPLEIVGVAESVGSAGPEASPGMQVYLPQPAESSVSSQFLVRSSRRSTEVIPGLQNALTRVLPVGMPRPAIRSLDEAFRAITAGRRANAMLMSVFGAIVLLVGAAGVYAVMASMIAQQQRELGVRLALGATPSQIARGVLGRAGVYLAAGLLVGLLAGRSLSSLFESLLFQVRPTDASVYAVVALLLLTVGLAAALLPALRASRVDPVVTLRGE